MKDGHRRILGQMSYAMLSRYVIVAVLAMRGFVLAHVFGPAIFGIWQSMRLVLSFGDFAHLGSAPGMVQLATRADGAELGSDARALRQTGHLLNLVGALIAAALVAGVTMVVSSPYQPLWWGISLLIVFRCTWHYTESLIYSQRRYAVSSTLSMLTALLTTGLGVVGAYGLGLTGFITALAVAYLILFLVANQLRVLPPSPALDRAKAALLMRTGFPIMLSNLLKLLLWNIDKILVWGLLGKLALGLYALQATITNAVMMIPAGVVDVLYPHVLFEFGRERSSAKAQNYLLVGTDLLSRLLCPVLAVTFLALHLPIHWWLPDYTATIPPGLVLVLASYFAISGTIPGTILTALDGRMAVLAATAAGVIVAAVSIWLAIAMGGGFVAVAAGAGVGLLFRSTYCIAAAAKRCVLPPAALMRLAGRLLLSFALLLAAVALPSWLFPQSPQSGLSDLLLTALRCLCALIVLAPWTYIAWRRYRLHDWGQRTPSGMIQPDYPGE